MSRPAQGFCICGSTAVSAHFWGIDPYHPCYGQVIFSDSNDTQTIREEVLQICAVQLQQDLESPKCLPGQSVVQKSRSSERVSFASL